MMNCADFLARIDEFVDGAAGVADASERIAHAQTCPTCAARVRELAVVGEAVRQAWDNTQAPQALRSRVRSALADESVVIARHGSSRTRREAREYAGVSRPVARLTRRTRVAFALLATAAAVVLTFGAWQLLSPPKPTGPSIVVVSSPVIEDTVARHLWCGREEHVFHRDADLPDDLSGVASKLADELGLTVLAPSLRDWGYSYVGARRCRVAGRSVAHLLYFAPKEKTMLSLFSMYRVHELEDPAHTEDAQVYFSLKKPLCPVLAWNEGVQTYALIGRGEQKDLLAIGQSLRGYEPVADTRLGMESLACLTP